MKVTGGLLLKVSNNVGGLLATFLVTADDLQQTVQVESLGLVKNVLPFVGIVKRNWFVAGAWFTGESFVKCSCDAELE